MRVAQFAKFAQHEELRALLFSISDTKLVEHTENDAYWGEREKGTGVNGTVEFWWMRISSIDAK